MANSYFIGQSNYSVHKQDCLREIVRNWILVAKGASKKHNNTMGFTYNSFNIFDLNAGNGKLRINGQTQDGSALIIASTADKWSTNSHWNVSYNIGLVEIDETHCNELKAHLKNIPKSLDLFQERKIEVYCLDNKDFLTQLEINPKTLSLFYLDPNGATLPFDELRDVLSASNCFDFLLHYNTVALKRCRKHKRVNKEGKFKPLEEEIDKFHKIRRYIWMSEPLDRWDWVFIFGTNTRLFDRSLTSLGFLDISTPEGMERLNQVSSTKKELN